ncbi:hypothetical protein GCM10027275_01030 [Rhabdobacter roseus]|uniref:DUF4249 domain-containing protein n=1 Tax=Rhabdobacter roseus TaxID=1655419 RepID=A0A840TJL3_9BACT|nr:DUF4249 domain-containing protein [Rhabdobacter roseus]MBB5281987.1 hypothetical protein [Rhabdobacter roseus]
MKYPLKRLSLLSLLWVLYSLHSCIEPFSPPEITSASSYLVVDGFLNTSAGTTSQIKLSRTQNLYENRQPWVEQQANLRVEGDQGSAYALAEVKPGTYELGGVSLAENEKYRLRIRTRDGKEYLSDYVPVVKTPPVDSVTYRVSPDRSGVQINVHTHDPTKRTRFYRWGYEETWEYHSPLYSAFEVVNKEIRLRTQDISTCWTFLKSSRIVLGTSVKLSQDIMENVPITYVHASSGKLRVKYSILVKQYGLSQEEFEYWTAIAKTNELTGSLFDPQPSQVTGNIRCINDPKELAFGFFSVSTPQEKRIFITEWLGRFTSPCEPEDTLNEAQALETYDLILVEFPVPGSNKPFYITGSGSCTDCRLHGGINEKPAYWQ